MNVIHDTEMDMTPGTLTRDAKIRTGGAVRLYTRSIHDPFRIQMATASAICAASRNGSITSPVSVSMRSGFHPSSLRL